MVDDKYIGIALAVSGSTAIGTSFIITKKGLNDAGNRSATYTSASDNHSYLRNPIWWAGMSTMVLGEAANFAAYTFAPPILVTPLGALSVLIGAVLASFLLNEELGHLGRLGCILCFLGSLIIVLHAPEDKEITNVDQILHYAIQPGFLLYCFSALVFSLVMIYAVVPRYGRSNPLVYISICSVVGSVSVMAIKGFGIAIKLTLGGKNQFTHPSTYVFGIVVAVSILVQMNYFNKALDTFSTNVVNPLYYVGFSTSTIVASLILFQGFNTTDTSNTVSLLAGFIVTFLGVHLLDISRVPVEADTRTGHSVLETGLLNPRLSLQGRMSSESWTGPGENAPRSRATHGRRSSIYRVQSAALYHAFEDGEPPAENVALQELREEEEEEEEGADERTQLRSARDREREFEPPPSRSQNPSPRNTPLEPPR